MDQLEQPSRTETAVLVGLTQRRGADWDEEDSLDELEQLSATAGARILHRFVCRQATPHPRYFIGKGKIEEIAEWVKQHKVETVIFDDDLSSAQGRNLEKVIDAKVIDRTQVILDIFGLHATSKEGRLQIDLARLEYLLPRLKRMWTHLERQKGGIGLRGGPGEQQMEVDRRRIQERITRLRRDLEGVRRHRAELRRGRRRHGWALVCLVGYTNAGKSTLLNSLTGAKVKTYNQLFVTLDPTTRQIRLPNHQSALITDTVGFIKKLPHHLVEAFKATLEEVVEADLLIHVIDASHPRAFQQIKAVESVLRELGAQDSACMAVLNKTDRPEAQRQWRSLARDFEHVVPVSALRSEGLEELRETIADCLRHRNMPVTMEIPLREAKLIATLRAAGNIAHERYDEEALHVTARIPPHLIGACEPYFVDSELQPKYNDASAANSKEELAE